MREIKVLLNIKELFNRRIVEELIWEMRWPRSSIEEDEATSQEIRSGKKGLGLDGAKERDRARDPLQNWMCRVYIGEFLTIFW